MPNGTNGETKINVAVLKSEMKELKKTTGERFDHVEESIADNHKEVTDKIDELSTAAQTREITSGRRESDAFDRADKRYALRSEFITLQKAVDNINSNTKWLVRLIIGMVVTAILAVVLTKPTPEPTQQTQAPQSQSQPAAAAPAQSGQPGQAGSGGSTTIVQPASGGGGQTVQPTQQPNVLQRAVNRIKGVN